MIMNVVLMINNSTLETLKFEPHNYCSYPTSLNERGIYTVLDCRSCSPRALFSPVGVQTEQL